MTGWKDLFPWTASAVETVWPEGPSRRKRWLVLAVLPLAIVAAHAVLTAYESVRTEQAEEDFVARFGQGKSVPWLRTLDPAADRPTPVEDFENKAKAVRAATDIMVLASDRRGGFSSGFQDYASKEDKTFTAADRDAIRKTIADNARAFALLDVAVLRRGANWGLHYERGLGVDIPNLLAILQLAKLNAAAGRLAVEDGRIDDALTALRRGTAIASSMDNEPILIVQLVRLAVRRLNAALVRRVLGSAILRGEHLSMIEASYPVVDPRRELRAAMIVETKAMSAIFRTGEGATAGLSRQPGTAGLLASSVVRVVGRPYLLYEERLWLEVMSARIDRLDKPLFARGERGNEPTVRSWDYPVRAILINLQSVEDRCDMAESRDGLLRAAIGIERRRQEQGRAPATLADSPIDPLNGKAFAYETDGARWRIRSTADLSKMAYLNDPVLDWSRN